MDFDDHYHLRLIVGNHGPRCRDNEGQDNFLLMQGSIVNTANAAVATLPRDRYGYL